MNIRATTKRAVTIQLTAFRIGGRPEKWDDCRSTNSRPTSGAPMVMTDPIKFFDDNISRLPRPISQGTADQQREYNLNAGLRAMAQHLTAIQHEQQRQSQELQRLQHLLLQTR